MQRITEKQLEAIVNRINVVTGSHLKPYTLASGKHTASIGNYHLSFAYDGVSLHQMMSYGGGIRDVFRCGHVTKRELANRMWAFIEGLESAKTLQVA